MLALLWIAATAAATGLAWAGVRTVAAEVAAPLPATPVVVGDARDAAPSGPAPSAAADVGDTVRTYDLVGGTATIRFGPGAVEVLGAVPAAGFAVDVEPEEGGIRVDFESDDHRSRLRAWWDDGPRRRIDEQGRDGDDGPVTAPDDDGGDDDDDGDDDDGDRRRNRGRGGGGDDD